MQSAEFTIVNECRSTIWPALVSSNGGPPITPSAFTLKTNESRSLTVPLSWNGRVWARTDCSTDTSSGNFSCVTGDCGSGQLECGGRGYVPPVTIVEFGVNQIQRMNFYDVSLVNGFNLPMQVVANGGESGRCNSPSCLADLNAECPEVLRADSKDKTVGCNSACDVFGTPVHCCSPNATVKCQPTLYSSSFKNSCPNAYNYATDDKTSTSACSSADYSIIFCPANTSYEEK